MNQRPETREHSISVDRPGLKREDVATLIDEIAELATRENVTANVFHRSMLVRAMNATGAAAGFVWDFDSALHAEHSDAGLRVDDIGLRDIVPNGSADVQSDRWRSLYAETAHASEPLALKPMGTLAGGGFQNPSRCTLVTAAIAIPSQPSGGVGLFLPADCDVDTLAGTRQLLSVVCELAGDFHRNRMLRELTLQQQTRDQFETFRQQALQCDEPKSLAWTIANEGRRFVQCDRVAVLKRSRRRFRVTSVSGIDGPDTRSTTVKNLQTLAANAASADAPVWLEAATDNVDAGATAGSNEPQGAGARLTGIYPLQSSPPNGSAKKTAHSVIVFETFGTADTAEISPDEMKRRADLMCEHFAPVLGMMSRIDQMPLIGLSRFLDRSFLSGLLKWRWKWLAVAALIGLAVCLAKVETDFEVEARGTLQPVEQEMIYAPRDGIVVDFPALPGRHEGATDDNARVKQGDVVIELRNADLEYEFTRILGEQQSTAKRLDTVAVLLEQQSRSSQPDQLQSAQLTAEKLELNIRLKSITRQLDILRTQQNELSIPAHIAGQIQTWDFDSRLRSRPVRQGAHLMTIANVDGPWRLELNLPDRYIDEINSARAVSNVPLSTRFLVKSAPGQHYEATLQEIAGVTAMVENQGLCVAAIGVPKDNKLPDNVRPGTAVLAKIDCGRRSLGYVWLHDLIRSVRQKLMF